MKKVYSIPTTAGKRYSIGVFSNGEMLKGSTPKYYKTMKGALKALEEVDL